jgi:hypothetical protein
VKTKKPPYVPRSEIFFVSQALQFRNTTALEGADEVEFKKVPHWPKSAWHPVPQ